MGLLEQGLSGLGRGMADVGETLLRAQVEEARQMRLAQYGASVNAERDQQKRQWEVEDLERKEKWEERKMGLAHEYAMRRKGLIGRGGGGGGGEAPSPERFLLDDQGNRVTDELGNPIELPSAAGGGGGRRSRSKSGSSGGSGKSGGDAASAYVVQEDPVTGNSLSCNKQTQECRPMAVRTPGAEYQPEVFDEIDRLNLEEGSRKAQIQDALQNKKPVSTQPGYRSKDTARAVKAKAAGDDDQYEWSGLKVGAKDVLSEWRAFNSDAPPSKRQTIEQFMKANNIVPVGAGTAPAEKPAGGLVSKASREPSNAPAASPVEEKAPDKPKPKYTEGQRAIHPRTRQWLVYRNGRWIPE